MLLAIPTLVLLTSRVFSLPTLLQGEPAHTSTEAEESNSAGEVSIERTDDVEKAIRRHRCDFEPLPVCPYIYKYEFPLFLSNIINLLHATQAKPSDDYSKDKVHNFIRSKLLENFLGNDIYTPTYPTPASSSKSLRSAVPTTAVHVREKIQQQKNIQHIKGLVVRILADLNPKLNF